MQLEPLMEILLPAPLGQLRAVPVQLHDVRALLLIHGPDAEIDPSPAMFFYPAGTLTLTLVSLAGEVLWQRDLGRGAVPGIWFAPVFPFDLDGDGIDELYLVDNEDAAHPLATHALRLIRLDAHTGEVTGAWAWLDRCGDQPMYMAYRRFIMGGYVHGEPVLVIGDGTYACMALRAYRPGMSVRWERLIDRGSIGARGSHMSPVVDLNQDGIDELLWGERVIELSEGRELFCCAAESYRGHSDIVQPVWDAAARRWCLYTCRESHPEAHPRVVAYDDAGRVVWGDVSTGHIDMGWVARLDASSGPTAYALRIGRKERGPDGTFRTQCEEFGYEALTGTPRPLSFSAYGTLPVDLNGDGSHELVRGQYPGRGEVLDARGNELGAVGGAVALLSKVADHPGEQVLSYTSAGRVRLWADRAAVDTPAAQARYANPYYALNQRLTAVGYNLVNLGGL